MTKIPNSVEKLLKRTESVLVRNWKHETNLSETRYNQAIYFNFLEFKKKIDNGSSIYVLKLEENNWESKIAFIKAITKYWSGLSDLDLMSIKNDVYTSINLESAMLTLIADAETRQEAQHLLDFIKDARYSCWGQIDEDAKSKIFRIVTTSDKFSQILNSDEVFDVTPRSKEDDMIQYKKIRVAMGYEPVDERMYMDKGLYDEYIKFFNEFQDKWDEKPEMYQLDINAFNLWNDVKDTAMYYIYISR